MEQRQLRLCLLCLLGCMYATSPEVLAVDKPEATANAAQHDAQVALDAALVKAGENRAALQQALDQVQGSQRESMEYLVRYMPERDLQRLSTDFLLEHVSLAHRVMDEVPWGAQIPHEIFLNEILPYANTTEKRDAWRKTLYDIGISKVKDAKSTSEAAAILNNTIFPELKVRYSTKRQRADQSPSQSIESGLASCSGLSILLIDACRSVGVPARFVGTPLWADGSGNHSWVEIWDHGWFFTGAAEPNGNALNAAWFTGRASQAIADDPLKAIYAVSYKKTPIHFPLVWDPTNQSISAVNVTERYTRVPQVTPPGQVLLRIRAVDRVTGDRVAASFEVLDEQSQAVAQGITKDERFDSNDHAEVRIPVASHFRLRAKWNDQTLSEQSLHDTKEGQLIEIVVGSSGE